jgi:nucleoside-diphosphate-sugar epimerase
MLRRIPDIHKIGQLLGWQPRVPLDGIISDVVDAHRTAAVV